MPFKFFVVPVPDGDRAEQELNDFLRRQRILSVEKRWVEQDATVFWHFCVSYSDQIVAALDERASEPSRPPLANRVRVDYKHILSPEDFAVFDRLRRKRKEISEKEAVPIDAVCNNEQRANMVRQRATSKSALEKIAGIGDARVEKYGERMLEILKQTWSGDEASQPAA
jgi:superfamily II DNA helicase RecQ